MANNPVWPFKKSREVSGYTNNPHWADNPEGTHRHSPCGYWPMAEVPTQPDINYILYSCGRDVFGILGRDGTDSNIFLPMDDTSHFYDVSLGNGFGMYIKHDKTLWGVGTNSGQLGTGDTGTCSTLTQAGTDHDWESISATAYQHSLAIKENGSLWASGSNNYGQLGLNDDVERLTFQQVGAEFDWKSVHGNGYSSYAIKKNGDLYSWGDGSNGNLGHGSTQEYHVPTRVTTAGGGFDSIGGGFYAAIGLKSGKIWSCGFNALGTLCLDNTTATNVFVERSAGETWNSVNCGHKHTMLVKSDGTLWGVGINVTGNLGLGDQAGRTVVTQVGSDTDWVSAKGNGASAFSLALKSNGSLWASGNNDYGQLGLGLGTVDVLTFTEVNGVWGTCHCGHSHSHIGEEVYDWG